MTAKARLLTCELASTSLAANPLNMRTFILVPLAALASFLGPLQPPALAQELEADAASQDSYERLVEIITADPGGVAANRLAEVMVESMMRASPDFAAIGQEHPDFAPRLRTALRPLAGSRITRIRQLHRPPLIARMREVLMPEEADEMADFYASELGQTLLHSADSNATSAMSEEQLASDEAFTEADAESDIAATNEAMMRSDSQSDLRAIWRYLAANPQIERNAAVLLPDMIAYRTAMENTPITPAEDEAILAAIEKVLGEFGYSMLPE